MRRRSLGSSSQEVPIQICPFGAPKIGTLLHTDLSGSRVYLAPDNPLSLGLTRLEYFLNYLVLQYSLAAKSYQCDRHADCLMQIPPLPTHCYRTLPGYGETTTLLTKHLLPIYYCIPYPINGQ